MNIHRSRFVDFTPKTITRLAFSHVCEASKPTPKDLRLAVGRNNGDIEIWNPRYGWYQELILKGGKGRTIEGLVWAADPEYQQPRLFSIGGSTVLTEWDLRTGMPLNNYDCNAGVIWDLAVNKSNTKIAVGCDNGTVVLVNIAGGPGIIEHDKILQRQNSRVLTVDFHLDELVVGGCADGKIRVWGIGEKSNGRLIGTLKVDKSIKRESTLVWSIKVLSKQNQIISGDSTGSLKVWDLKHLTLLQSFDTHKGDILSLATNGEETSIFSAGVDRKIFNYNLLANPNNKDKKQWVNSSSKLLHSNDIRFLASFESKSLSLLVSGGVDRQLVISSIKFFNNKANNQNKLINNSNLHKKLSITSQSQTNMLRHQTERLIIMWQDQTIKIWKIFKKIHENNKNYKLVSKLVLADEENIMDVAISNKGDYLAVSYLTSIKIFKLIHDHKEEKITVQKMKVLSSKLENVGGKLIQFTNDGSNLIIVDSENDILKVNIFDYDESTELLQTMIYELPEVKNNSSLTHMNIINKIAITEDDRVLAVSRYSGTIDLVFINEESQIINSLAKLNVAISAMSFSKNNTLILVTIENKIYEFNITKPDDQQPTLEEEEEEQEVDDVASVHSVLSTNSAGSNLLLTNWSKQNSESLPEEFLNLDGKCQGIFNDVKVPQRIWIWGPEWMGFIDLNDDFSNFSKAKASRINLKRSYDGLSVFDSEEETQDLDKKMILKENNEQNVSETFNNDQWMIIKEDGKIPFWITNKYQSVLYVGNFGNNDLVVVERPITQLPATKAFETNQIIF